MKPAVNVDRAKIKHVGDFSSLNCHVSDKQQADHNPLTERQWNTLI